MPQPGVTGADINRNLDTQWQKRKRDESTNIDVNEPRKMRGTRTDYWRLQNPLEEEEETFLIDDEEPYAIIAGDKLTSLREAKDSPDWHIWQKTMDIELDVLKEMGTWELVPKPLGAVPISNKWTFVKKRNKEGEVIRHRARLVVKGCSQRPGQDYMETYSPVVRLDTLRAILALVPIKGLKVHQLDIKGAYLNRILQETIYMKQPEDREDGTGRVCRLKKTMYGLKQSGHEWNRQLDARLTHHRFKRL
jgi:hypothetical protein